MSSAQDGKVRIMYVGPLNERSTAHHRVTALGRLGYEVRKFDTTQYMNEGGWFWSAARFYTLRGPTIARFNADILRAVEEYRPTHIWLDKASFLWRETAAKMKALNAYLIHQNDDNPFSPRKDPGWRLIVEALPEYDLHLVPRRVSFADYRKAGAKDIFWFVPSYEPSLHYPPPEGWSDENRTIDVAFVGFPHDKRPKYLYELWKHYGFKIKVWGDHRWGRKWPRAKLPVDGRTALYQGASLTYDQYRETIWKSRISLGFVSNLNLDEFSGRSFEIPASGGFLLVEDTPGHREMYRDGEEAIFFNSVEDCAQKIQRYLPDEEARTRISRAGRLRASTSGYDTDSRVAQVMNYILSK